MFGAQSSHPHRDTLTILISVVKFASDRTVSVRFIDHFQNFHHRIDGWVFFHFNPAATNTAPLVYQRNQIEFGTKPTYVYLESDRPRSILGVRVATCSTKTVTVVEPINGGSPESNALTSICKFSTWIRYTSNMCMAVWGRYRKQTSYCRSGSFLKYSLIVITPVLSSTLKYLGALPRPLILYLTMFPGALKKCLAISYRNEKLIEWSSR